MTRWIEDWIVKLSEPDPQANNLPLCPYAKQAWNKGQVKVIETIDLWDTVYEQIDRFDGTHRVVMCVEEEPKQTYFELDAACMALNQWFARTGFDVWLLAYQEERAIVFIQTLSDLDDAADTLQKLGYYEQYSDADYQRLVKARSELRRRL